MSGKTWVIGVPAALVALMLLGGASIPVARGIFAPGSDDPPYAGVARVNDVRADIVRGQIIAAWGRCREALRDGDRFEADNQATIMANLQATYDEITGKQWRPPSECP